MVFLLLVFIVLNINGYTDWFLPIQAELNLMYLNLKKNGMGGFSDGYYWSSSQANEYFAWTQRFSDGHQSISDQRDEGGSKSYANSVRACRQF